MGMPVINPSILSKVVKTITPKNERVEESQLRGTIVFSSGEYYIQLDGAPNDSLTPIANIEEGASDSGFVHGDRVLVLIKNHQAIVTKNLTTGLQAQAAKDAGAFTTAITDEGITAQRIIANDTFTNTLRANDITADEIVAGMATIDSLDTTYAHITNGVIDNATIDQADVNNLEANYAHVTNGVIDNAKIGHADVNGLNANYAHITNGVIDNAKIDQADVNNLEANYAHVTNGVIDNATIDQADVNNLSANYAHVTNGVIDNAKIGHADVDGLNTTYAHITSGVIDNAKIDQADVNNLEANYAHVTNGVIDTATIDQAKVNNLSANYAHTTNGIIDNAKIDQADVNNLEANYAHVTNGVIDNAKIGHADVNGLNANYAHITNGAIDNAEIDYADVKDLNTHYAEIDLANVNNAWIQNGVIKDAAISDAQIIGVSANKLTAGTIDASNITVTNLNADNITAGTLNGQRIGTGSLSLDKLSEEVPTKDYVDDVAENLQGQIDGQIETWTGTVVPTLNNSPASAWTTADERHKHVGDIYYVVNAGATADGYTYRFTESGTTTKTYSWTLIKDNQITKALQDILDMQGDISDIQTFDNQISSWKTDTDSELSSLKSKTSTLETNLGNKVDTTTFNELSQTVDENSSSITSLTTTVNNKADSSTVTTLSNTVSSVQQTANSNSSTISQLTTTLGTNADGTTKANDIVHKVSDVQQDLDGFKITVEETYATQDEVDGKADASTVYTKAQIDQTVSGINASVSAKADSAETTAALSLKANKATLTSEINASADTVKINADKVNITGVITAINNDTTTTIDGEKITTGSITVGNVDATIQNAVETAQNTFIFDTTYTMSGTTASFEAHLYKGGVDVKEYVDGNDDPLYPPSMFTWYLKHEDSQTQQGDYIGYGYRINVDISTCNYGAEVIAHFTTTEDSPLLNGNDDNLTDANNNTLTGRTESGESVRVRDLTVATSLSGVDKLMVIGVEDEHLVSVNTLQAYLNANLDKQVKFNTTTGWNSQTSLVSQANTLYIYTDHQIDSQGRNVAGIKVGDGLAYVVDLPFTDAIATEHIANTTVHITSAERAAWNSKVRCYYSGVENLVFTTA